MKNRFIKILCCLSICSLGFSNLVYANPSEVNTSENSSIEQSVVDVNLLEFTFLDKMDSNPTYYIYLNESKTNFEFVINVDQEFYNNINPSEVYTFDYLKDYILNKEDFGYQLEEFVSAFNYDSFINYDLLDEEEEEVQEQVQEEPSGEESQDESQDESQEDSLEDSQEESQDSQEEVQDESQEESQEESKEEVQEDSDRSKDYLIAGVLSFVLLLIGFVGVIYYKGLK